MPMLDGGTNGTNDNGNGGGSTGGADSSSAGGGNSSNTSWRDSIPQELREDPSLKAFSDIGQLAKSYVETKKMVGKKGVIVPTDKDGDDAWNNFYKQIGLPESVDKYDVAPPEGAKVNPEFLKVFKDLAHKNGILPKQAKQFLGAYLSLESAAQKEQQEKREREDGEGVENLKKEWGKAFDYKVSLAKRAIGNLKIEGLQDWIDKSGNGNNPYLVKILAAFEEANGEDTITGDGAGSRMTKTPSEIQTEITEIMSNKGHPKHEAYMSANHPAHRDALKYVEELYKQLHPAS